jgi:probable phosphoglycerate mutase
MLLLRHGETAHSGSRRFSGIGDLPLTERGEAQARRVAARLRDEPRLDAIVSSPLPRAVATATVISEAVGVAVTKNDDLKETDFGEWEGLTFDEAREKWSTDLARWLVDPEFAPPGGESIAATSRRVVRARDAVLAAYPEGRLLVVSHVTPIKALVRLAVDAPGAAVFRMHLDLAALSVIDYFGEQRAVLRLYNDTSHLAGV